MKKILSVAALAMLVGCGMSEDAFEEQSIDATCDWLVECFATAYPDHADCVTEFSGGDELDDCWNYDSGKAKECVDALEELTCDDTEPPAVCMDVYTDEDCEDTGA